MSFKVRIAQADRTIDVPTGATILATALDAGIAYPFGCQSGNCGACKSHLVKGEVTMEGYSEFALSDEEKARGLILACRAVPWEDSEVAWLEEDDLIVHPRRLLDCQRGRARRRHARHQAHSPGDRLGRAVRLLGRPVRLGDLRGLPAARLFHGQRAGRSGARVPCAPHRGRRHQHACRDRAQARRSRPRRRAVRPVLSARRPSRADHRRRRRLGHGADQVGRRAGAAEGAAAAHLLLFRRPHRARPLPARPFRRAGRDSTTICTSFRC